MKLFVVVFFSVFCLGLSWLLDYCQIKEHKLNSLPKVRA